MPRYRNDTGQVLISLDFGVIGPGEFVGEHYDPKEHGVIPGCTQVDDDPPEDDSSGDASSAPADEPPARKRRSAAGQDKETPE